MHSGTGEAPLSGRICGPGWLCLCHHTTGRTDFSSCGPRAAALPASPWGGGRWTQAGFVFSHSTPGRQLPLPPADCTLSPATEPRGGGHRQILYYRAAPGREPLFQLQTEPLTYHHTQAGSPPPQVCEEGAGSSLKKAPQLEIRSLSVSVQGLYPVQIWSYNSLASLSLPLVSLQKAVPPLHAHAAFFLNLPHFTVTHLSFLQLSHFLPSRCSLFSSQALVFKVFWLLHLFV